MSYIAKYHHAIVTIILCLICMLLGVKYQRVASIFNLGALGFAILTAVILALIVMESLNERVRVMTYWMDSFAKLDDDGKMAVTFQFPTIRYHMRRGVPHPYWRDTGVKMEHLQLFLEDSDKKQISPERNWNSAKKPRSVWLEIKTQLEDDGMVELDSAAGSHSWLWIGDSYQHMLAWWKVGRHIKDDTEIGMSGPTRQYASETEGEDLA